MKRAAIVFTMLALAFNVSVGLIPAQAGDSVKVFKNFIKVNAVKYRRANAESAEIGAVGEKLSPAFKVPRFHRQFDWPSRAIGVREVTTISLTSKQRHELKGKATKLTGSGRQVKGSVKGAGSVAAKYQLVKLEFSDRYDVKEALNENKKALTKIKNLQKKKARIVSAVWVLVEGSEKQASQIRGTLQVGGPQGNGSFSLTQQGHVQFEFSPDTVMAYQIDRFEWEKKQKKIKKLKPDQVWR